jgi:hypothetical protein
MGRRRSFVAMLLRMTAKGGLGVELVGAIDPQLTG